MEQQEKGIETQNMEQLKYEAIERAAKWLFELVKETDGAHIVCMVSFHGTDQSKCFISTKKKSEAAAMVAAHLYDYESGLREIIEIANRSLAKYKENEGQ